MSSPSPSPGRGAIAPRMRPQPPQCRSHNLVLRPDGSCVVCEREGGPNAASASRVYRRGSRARRPWVLWGGLGALVVLVAAGWLWIELMASSPSPSPSGGDRGSHAGRQPTEADLADPAPAPGEDEDAPRNPLLEARERAQDQDRAPARQAVPRALDEPPLPADEIVP